MSPHSLKCPRGLRKLLGAMLGDARGSALAAAREDIILDLAALSHRICWNLRT
jgi:hypothetical protein